MNYLNVYNNLINKAKSEGRIKSWGLYYEWHHIIPKCLGGNNLKDNLVLLTAREHFIAHKLLAKINKGNSGIVYAVWAMVHKVSNKHYTRNYIVGSREYEYYRKLFAETASRHLMGYSHTEETKNKMRGPRESVTGNKNPMFGKVSAMKGKTQSEFCREMCRKANLNKLVSETTRTKISESHKHREIITCQYCNTSTRSKMNYIKYHGENCKKNPNRKVSIYKCNICGLESENKGNMNRYHFNNCKLNGNI